MLKQIRKDSRASFEAELSEQSTQHGNNLHFAWPQKYRWVAELGEIYYMYNQGYRNLNTNSIKTIVYFNVKCKVIFYKAKNDN